MRMHSNHVHNDANLLSEMIFLKYLGSMWFSNWMAVNSNECLLKKKKRGHQMFYW